MIEEQGAGLSLISHFKAIGRNPPSGLVHEQPLFTQKDVEEKFKLILSDSRFRDQANSIRLECLAAGGKELAAQTVEKTYLAGTKCKIDPKMVAL